MNIVFLYCLNEATAMPFAEAGHTCWLIDIQHPQGIIRNGNIVKVGADLRNGVPDCIKDLKVGFVAAFPPCDHLAVNGARWFKGKGLRLLALSVDMFATAAEYCEACCAPYFIENPVSTISTYWRKADFSFDPWQYAHLVREDNYTKKNMLMDRQRFCHA